VKRVPIWILPVAIALLVAAPGARAAPTRYGELTVVAPGTPGTHVLAVRRAPFAFDLLGARWRARPGVAVAVRARGSHGAWSPWTSLAADGGGPVAHADPVWVAGSDELQLRVTGALRLLHVALVAPDRSPLRPLRVLQSWAAEPALQ
jgi:hypothetical protein